jgi:hypothetical protein
MRVHVCVCVCECVRACARVHVCVFVCARVHLCVCVSDGQKEHLIWIKCFIDLGLLSYS